MEKHWKEKAIPWLSWLFIYLLPVIYLMTLREENGVNHEELYNAWRHITPFFLVYLLHHFVLVPFLYERKHLGTYIVAIALTLALFSIYQIIACPDGRLKPRQPHKKEMREKGKMRDHMPPPHQHEFKEGRPYLLLRAPIAGRIFTAFLIMGFDIGMFAIIRSEKEKKRHLALEKEKLKIELECLKYQLNPHFFMNTLNNIHSLIDIDGQQAQRAIIELSKMLRYVLYESNAEMVPIAKEVEFIRLYMSLMEMRCNDNIDLQLDLHTEGSNAMVPPLLFICFVENAFKHGISNREKSYIHVKLTESDDAENLMFACTNSNHEKKDAMEHHGIGLDNVRKRLELLYGNEHSLIINNIENEYNVCLMIPTHQKQ